MLRQTYIIQDCSVVNLLQNVLWKIYKCIIYYTQVPGMRSAIVQNNKYIRANKCKRYNQYIYMCA